jgi:hypothetical protein
MRRTIETFEVSSASPAAVNNFNPIEMLPYSHYMDYMILRTMMSHSRPSRSSRAHTR